jgi:sporulation protein YlmC with PRC-barrel domain
VAIALAAPAVFAQPLGTDYPSYEPSAAVKNGYTAEDIMDADIRGSDGKKIGEVEDVIIGPDNKLRRVIVSVNEGWFGTGGRTLAVAWNDLKVGERDDDEIEYFTAPVTKQNVEEYGLFKDKQKAVKGGKREWRASELLGDYISLKDVDDYGVVNDLMFDRQGQLRGVAAAPDIDSPVLQFYAPYSGGDKGWDPGDEYYEIPYSRSELEKLLPPDKAKNQRSASAD